MRWNRRRAAGLAFAVTLPVYLATMSRAIGFIDRGELAAAAWTFGIPHPTGYPTLMLVAGALAHLSPLRPVLTLNAFAAFLVAAGAAVMVLLLDRVLDATGPADEAHAGRRATLALLGALGAAFSTTWWQQANGFEVYALHALLMPLVVLLFLRWTDAADADRDGPLARRAGFAFALVTGLSFTNHGTTLLLAPGLIAAAAVRFGPGAGLARRVVRLVPAFLLGLLPIAWLPIRSAMHPAMDWGATRTLAGFLGHVTGGDYRGWMFPGWSDFVTQLRFIAWRLPGDFAWIGIPLAALGAVALARHRPALAVFAVLTVVAGIVFAAGYRIVDLDSYLLTAVFGMACLVVAGLARVAERTGARAALATALALVALNVGAHARDCDEHDLRLAADMFDAQLAALPEGTLFVTSLWDFGLSQSFYAQLVEGRRRDVTYVNPELMLRRWYLSQLRQRAPGLMRDVAAEDARLDGLLADAEAGRVLDGAQVEAARSELLEAMVTRAMPVRAVFVPARYPWLPAGLDVVPVGLAYRVWRPEDGYLPEPAIAWTPAAIPARADAYAAIAAWLCGETRVKRAEYERSRGYPDRAGRALASAAAFDPHLRPGSIGVLPLAAQEAVLHAARFFARLPAPPALATSEP